MSANSNPNPEKSSISAGKLVFWTSIGALLVGGATALRLHLKWLKEQREKRALEKAVNPQGKVIIQRFSGEQQLQVGPETLRFNNMAKVIVGPSSSKELVPGALVIVPANQGAPFSANGKTFEIFKVDEIVAVLHGDHIDTILEQPKWAGL